MPWLICASTPVGTIRSGLWHECQESKDLVSFVFSVTLPGAVPFGSSGALTGISGNRLAAQRNFSCPGKQLFTRGWSLYRMSTWFQAEESVQSSVSLGYIDNQPIASPSATPPRRIVTGWNNLLLNKIFRPYFLGFSGLALAVALWGYGYKLSPLSSPSRTGPANHRCKTLDRAA